MKRYLRTRLDQLDAKGFETATQVMIEMDLCATQADYESAFKRAWKKVPAGAIVYCWLRPLSDLEYIAMVEGRLEQPHVIGLFLKQRMLNHPFGPRPERP